MCVLHVTSQTKSFSRILESNKLPIYRSHEKGDIRNIGKKVPENDYGFSCEVSNREWTDLSGQFEDALTFLTRHERELTQLVGEFEVSDIRLDFPYSNREMFMQCDYLAPELLKKAGNLGVGIELSLYPPENSDNGVQTIGGKRE